MQTWPPRCTRERSSSWQSCGTVSGGIAPRGVASSEGTSSISRQVPSRANTVSLHCPTEPRSSLLRSAAWPASYGHLGGRWLLRHHSDDRRMSFPRISGHGPAYENLLNSAYCPELSNSSPGALNRATVDIPSSDRFAVKPVGLSK